MPEEKDAEAQGEQVAQEQTPGREDRGDVSGDESTGGEADELTERGDVETEGEASAEAEGAEGPLELEELGKPAESADSSGIELLMDVDLEVKIELGRAQMPIEEILRLRKGAVVELDKLAGDPVDILVNARRVARGEILVVNDNFCVRVTEIIDPEAVLRGKDEQNE